MHYLGSWCPAGLGSLGSTVCLLHHQGHGVLLVLDLWAPLSARVLLLNETLWPPLALLPAPLDP